MTNTTHTPTPWPHNTKGGEAWELFYKGWYGKTPGNAVRLAVADIHKTNSGTLDFVHELNRAATMCDEHDALTARVAELEAALRLCNDALGLSELASTRILRVSEARAAARAALKGSQS